MRINIKTCFKNNKMVIPSYAHKGDAGIDLQANIEGDILLSFGERKLIPTGIKASLPTDIKNDGGFSEDYVWELQARPRSGLAHKFGLTIVNSPGTIDSHYRGEIFINLQNTGKDKVIIKPGDKICQIVLSKKYIMDFNEVDDLEKTERGEDGHGSTGV